MPSEFLTRATAWDLEVLRRYDVKFLLGDLHDDFRTGLWCQTYVSTKLKASADPPKVTDFMPLLPQHAAPRPKQSVAQMAAMLRSWARSHGAEVPKG